MNEELSNFMGDLSEITVFTIMEQTENGNYEILFTTNHQEKKIKEIKELIEKCKLKYDIKNVENVGSIPLENNNITNLYRASLIIIGRDHWKLQTEKREDVFYYKAICEHCDYSTKWFKNINTIYKLQKKHNGEIL